MSVLPGCWLASRRRRRRNVQCFTWHCMDDVCMHIYANLAKLNEPSSKFACCDHLPDSAQGFKSVVRFWCDALLSQLTLRATCQLQTQRRQEVSVLLRSVLGTGGYFSSLTVPRLSDKVTLYRPLMSKPGPPSAGCTPFCGFAQEACTF